MAGHAEDKHGCRCSGCDCSAESLLPNALRWSAPLLEIGYRVGLSLHQAFSRPRRAPLPVICVGNLTVGGTGKTPAVQYFARGLAARGHRPAVLMRGYKNQGADEARESTRALADACIPVLVGADRYENTCHAEEQGCSLVLLDDGFQHWQLLRDIDIVLIDATKPFGNGHLLPRGILREPVDGLARAGVVIITRADLCPKAHLDALEEHLRQFAPGAVIARAQHLPVSLRDCQSKASLSFTEHLKGAKVFAVCGIGNPCTFFHSLTDLGAELVGGLALKDHCHYTRQQLETELIPAARHSGAKAIIVTEKDAAKLEPLLEGLQFPVWVLGVRFELISAEQEVWARIAKMLNMSAALAKA